MPFPGFWSSCAPQGLRLDDEDDDDDDDVVEAARLQRAAPHPAEGEAKTHQAAWSLSGPVTSGVVGPEPRSHFSASTTLIVRLAAPLGLGHKKLIELPGRCGSGHPCRKGYVVAVMRGNQSQVDPPQKPLQRARGS